MIADLMPQWLRRFLKIDTAQLDDGRWTWRHFCRFGRNPARTLIDAENYRQKLQRLFSKPPAAGRRG